MIEPHGPYPSSEPPIPDSGRDRLAPNWLSEVVHLHIRSPHADNLPNLP